MPLWFFFCQFNLIKPLPSYRGRPFVRSPLSIIWYYAWHNPPLKISCLHGPALQYNFIPIRNNNIAYFLITYLLIASTLLYKYFFYVSLCFCVQVAPCVVFVAFTTLNTLQVVFCPEILVLLPPTGTWSLKLLTEWPLCYNTQCFFWTRLPRLASSL